MRTRGKSMIAATGLLLMLVALGGCGSSSDEQSLPTASIPASDKSDELDSSSPGVTNAPELKSAATPPKPQRDLHPEVQIKTNLGQIRLQLDAKKAPQTVENFLENYVDRDHYQGTVFHYVESEFIVIAGGYTADLKPKNTRAPIRNESRGAAKNVRGTVAMARDPQYADSATSHFFFNLVDNPSLDYQESDEEVNEGYCVFGKIIDGMDVVTRIAAAKVHDVEGFPNVPVEPVVIESISRVKSTQIR